jgi:hypothetical protein
MSPLARTICRKLKEKPQQFSEIVDAHRDVAWRDFLRAWGEIREKNILQRDDDGRYLILNARKKPARR